MRVIKRNHWRSLIALFTIMGLAMLTVPSGASAQPGSGQTIGGTAGETDDQPLAMNLQGWIKKFPGVAAAKDSLTAGKVEEAIKQLVTAVQANPELPPAELLLAEFYFAGGNQPAAIAALDRAALEFPTDPEPYLVLGNYAFMQNRNTDARVLFERAAALSKSFQANELRMKRVRLRVHAGLASVEERADKWDKCLPHLIAWTRLDPKNPAARIRLARAYFRTKRGKESYREAQVASELNPKFGKAPILVAQFYTENSEKDRAEQWLSEAEKRHGDDLNTRLKLAEWRWKQGDLEKAKLHAEAAYKIDSSSAAAAILSGMVAQAEQDYVTAEKRFEVAYKAAPEDFAPGNHLAMLLATLDDREKTDRALELAQENRKRFPNSAVAVATLGWVQYQLGQTADARKNYELAGSAGRGTGNMGYFFGRFWADVGNKEQAANVLKQVLSNDTLFVFRRDAKQLYDQLSN